MHRSCWRLWSCPSPYWRSWKRSPCRPQSLKLGLCPDRAWSWGRSHWPPWSEVSPIAFRILTRPTFTTKSASWTPDPVYVTSSKTPTSFANQYAACAQIVNGILTLQMNFRNFLQCFSTNDRVLSHWSCPRQLKRTKWQSFGGLTWSTQSKV